MDKRILLIDFDPVAAELTGALLATRGIPFTLARNHAELDRALAADLPALVVIDPARPDENEGLHLCTSVAERLGPGGRVPIVLASRSLRGARWKALARDAGAELFLERPRDDRLLLAAAERALRQADAALDSPQPAPTAVPPTAGAAAPPAPGPTTAPDPQRAPPPPENDLESMVDRVFAKWFAGGEGRGPSAPARSPTPAPAPRPAASLAPAAARAGTAAAVLEPPCADPADVDRAPTGSVRPSAPLPAPVAAASTPVPPARVPAASTALRPTGSTAPPRLPAAPQPAVARPAPPVATPAEAASARPGANLVRPLAMGAAVVLIGLGVGFVVLQKAGGPEEAATEVAVSTSQGAQPTADQQAIAAEPAAVIAAATPPGATPSPAMAPPDPVAKVVPERPSAEPPASAKTALRTDSPIQDAAATRPAPAAQLPATPSPPTGSPSPATAPAVAPMPAATTASEVPDPQPEAAEFIPDIAPDGTLPAAKVASDATVGRYVGPELIASTRATPAFPPGARHMRMSGQVRLQVTVRADGSVGAVTVLSEPKPVVGFGKAAEAAVRQWRYRPATMGSRAVESEIVVVVHFAGD